MSATSFDPIIAEDDKRPAVRPGTVVVIYDGNRARVLGGRPDGPQPQLAKPVQPAANLPPQPSEPIFNTDTAVGRQLSDWSTKAARFSVNASAAGGRQLVSLFKRTSLGTKLFGPGERYFLVDIGRRSGEVSFEMDSGDPGIPFIVTITFLCRVVDPAAVIEDGIRDMFAYHAGTLRRVAADIGVNYPVTEVAAARAAIQAELVGGVADHAIELGGVSVRVTTDARAVAFIREASQADMEIAASQARQRVENEQRSHIAGILASPEKVLAQWVATGNEVYRDIYANLIESSAKDRAEQQRLLLLALDKGLIEPHEIRARYPALADMLVDGVAGNLRQPDAPQLEATPSAPEDQETP